MVKAILTFLALWAAMVILVASISHWSFMWDQVYSVYLERSNHIHEAEQIMEDMLDSYSYMSYAYHVEPFDFHKWSGYELQWELSCEKLDKFTTIDLTPKKCKWVFLIYRWL